MQMDAGYNRGEQDTSRHDTYESRIGPGTNPEQNILPDPHTATNKY